MFRFLTEGALYTVDKLGR